MEANIAALFELLGVAFTGNSSRVLALCQDKFKTKAILSSFGIPTPRCTLVTSVNQKIDLDFPLIVKPNSEDGSLGIGINAVVFTQDELRSRITTIITNYEQPALIEEYIQGREFNIAILDNSGPKALPVSEIDFSGMPEGAPHICSYEAKWYEDDTLFIGSPPICPAHIDHPMMQRLQKMALTAFKAMDCRDYARVDFRIADDGTFYVLEVNPNPDISRTAGYARALAAAGLEYQEFWQSMIHNAVLRKPQ
ncbi:MAG: ATP-grasp domain-containing protein [Candidatus Aminicenantes bacterium]|nr:ATP-grasp domain-containing protein [Candidatus Aminicenantes bacterium]